MSEIVTQSTPELELWAECYSVGPYGYADSAGEAVSDLSVNTAKAVSNQPGQLHDISWVNFSLFVGNEPHRIGESLIATSQKQVHKVSFRPVSEVIEGGKLTKHTSKWIGYLILGEKPPEVPDRFDELVRLLYS